MRVGGDVFLDDGGALDRNQFFTGFGEFGWQLIDGCRTVVGVVAGFSVGDDAKVVGSDVSVGKRSVADDDLGREVFVFVVAPFLCQFTVDF